MSTYDDDEDSVQDSQPIELVKVSFPGGTLFYAAGDEDFAIDADGDSVIETYLATPLQVGNITINKITDQRELTLTLPTTDPLVILYGAGPIQGYGPPPRDVYIQVWRLQRRSFAVLETWSGYAGGQAFNDHQATIRVPAGIDDALVTEIPNVVLQRSCNTFLFSPRCTMDRTSFSIDTTVTAISADNKTITVAAVKSSGGTPAYHTHGIIKHNVTTEQRTISLQHGAEPPPYLLLDIDLPFRKIAIGDSINITAGCDLQVQTCAQKFGNVANFRGHPIAPLSDPFVTNLKNLGS